MGAGRDRAISAALRNDGRRLDDIGVFAHQRGGRWDVETLSRADFLTRLDARGQDAEDDRDRSICKDLAAWARGLKRGLCPKVWVYEDGALGRGTISLASPKGGK